MASLRRVMWYIEKHGPYDGIFGFSQGAVLVSILSTSTCWRGLFGLDACPWRFAICANAGGTSFIKGLRLAQADGESCALSLPISLPSLHIVGRWDFHARASRQLVSQYDGSLATVYPHAHAHELPMPLAHDHALFETIRDFLRAVSL